MKSTASSSSPSTSAPPPTATQIESDGSESDTGTATSSGDSKENDNEIENDAEKEAKVATANLSSSVLSSIMNGIFHGIIWVIISLYLPFIVSPKQDAIAIYQLAYNYKYKNELSIFDNTIWTYGTDYVLAIIMIILSYKILSMKHKKNDNNNNNEYDGNHNIKNNIDVNKLCNVSASMLILYAISVLAGGVAHHHFLTVESRNTVLFRSIWTMCVGTVCLAPASMGIIGNECIKLFRISNSNNNNSYYYNSKKNSNSKNHDIGNYINNDNEYLLLKSMPLITDTYWIIYSIVISLSCAFGLMSFQRPACDIFIAGTTQTPSTFYCMAFLYVVKHHRMNVRMKFFGLLGFIMNAFLLPVYPILVLHYNWTLPSVNTFLHTWLCIAWSTQGILMIHIIRSLKEEQHQEDEKQCKSLSSALLLYENLDSTKKNKKMTKKVQ